MVGNIKEGNKMSVNCGKCVNRKRSNTAKNSPCYIFTCGAYKDKHTCPNFRQVTYEDEQQGK